MTRPAARFYWLWPTALAAALYARTLAGTYVYDDVAIVRDDPRVRHVRLWWQLLTRDYFNGGVDNLYRPVTSLSYAVGWLVHDDRPWAFHAVNVVLHAAVTAVVAVLARRLTGGRSAGVAAGLMFACHPVHVEAVANIVGRAEEMCGLCVVSALLVLFTRPLTTARAAAGLAIGLVGLFCKEQAVVQPILWLLAWRLFRRPDADGRPAKLLAVTTLWTWAGYLAVREHFFKFEWDRSFLDWSVQPMIRSTGVDRALMPVVLAGHYARLLVWPSSQSPDYGGDVVGSVVSQSDPYLWAGVVAVVGWAVLTIRSRRRPVPLFCLLAFAVVYGTTGNVISLIGTNMAERLMYLPSAFLAVVAGAVLFSSGDLPPHKTRLAARWVGLTVVTILGSAQTVRYSGLWIYPHDLFADTLSTHPGSVQLALLLAQSDRDARHYQAAENVLADACARHPDYYRVWVVRAENAMDRHEWVAAHRWLATAARDDANHQQVAAALQELAEREAKAASHP